MRNLIVEIIKVIPGTSKKKGGGKEVGLKEQSLRNKTNYMHSSSGVKQEEESPPSQNLWKQFSFLPPPKLAAKMSSQVRATAPKFGSDARV